VKLAPVAESQFEILRVGCIKNSQPHQTAGNSGDRANYAIDDDGVASGAILDGEGIGVEIV